MFTYRKPTATALERLRVIQSTLDYSYSAVGVTRDSKAPNGFVVDHTRGELGKGADVFTRAKAALERWQQFQLGWLEAFPDNTPIRAGETVLVVARAGGLWWANAARIVYVIDEKTDALARFGFAYGTLPAHVETGEERFLIEHDLATDIVYFDIFAFSQPRHFLVRLNRRRARVMQKRFATEAVAAMQRAVE